MRRIIEPPCILLLCYVIQTHWSACTSANVTQLCVKAPHEPLAVRHFDGPLRARRSTEAAPPLRIATYYSGRFKKSYFAQRMKDHMIMPALSYWSGVLKAKNPASQPLIIPRKCKQEGRTKTTDANGKSQTYCAHGCEEQERCGIDLPDELFGECREKVDGEIKVTTARGESSFDADFLLIVDYNDHQDCFAGAGAFARVCSLESELDRPVLGYVNLCPRRIKTVPPEAEENVMMAKHEVAHALGFSDQILAFMRKEDGSPRTPRDETTGLPVLGKEDDEYIPSQDTMRKIPRSWKSTKETDFIVWKSLVTPAILAAAREHYACPTLDGVDLDNYGGQFHFEKKNMMDELMVPKSSLKHITNMTLGFFKDTGWYDVDMSKADQLQWGRGLGCTFVQGSCYEYMEERRKLGQSIYPWCDDAGGMKDRCVGYANAHGRCNLIKYRKKLPKLYRYFKSLPGVPVEDLRHYGGDVSIKYCPYVQAESNCLYDNEDVTKDRDDNDLLEYIGADSMCFNHTLGTEWNSYRCRHSSVIASATSSCRRFTCSPRSGLTLTVLGKSIQCPLLGGSVKVNAQSSNGALAGMIDCPACSAVCQTCPEPR